jgi:hypothetical protein
MWNFDETSIQVSKSRIRVLARNKSNAIYSTIPKFEKWLIINYVMNVKRGP